jgi:bla regulator protein BlaR1
MPVGVLATRLAGVVGRLVIEKTGLQGTFNFGLKWAADLAGAEPSGDAPSIFTALQEQLGLKLESSRGPVEVLVVDHVEQPTPD